MSENAPAPAADPIRSPLSPPLNSPPRILVVDDDEVIRRLNAEVLARAGYVVDAAGDGAAAWEALNCKSYDLLITDNRMPKVTGLELLEMVRGARLGLPVIMASGTLPIDEFDRQPWLKPTAMFCKPYLLEALVQTVDQVLGGSRPTRLG
jgi:DNA-binding NtrC family response regulator